MTVACFIPVKANSERVKGKNFRLLGGKPLYEIAIDKAVMAGCFDDVYVDTNSDMVHDYAMTHGAAPIERESKLAENTANGNDLLVHHFLRYPGYGAYFQLFVTAPLLTVKTIQSCVHELLTTTEHDSVFTAVARHGFFWWNKQPVNYLPNVLPRSQDLIPVMEETTGLYGIAAAAIDRYRARIGAEPLIHYVSQVEAADLNTEEDFEYVTWCVERGAAVLPQPLDEGVPSGFMC